jgi:hypothetical protein
LNSSNHSENPPLAIQQQRARANDITKPPTPPKATNTATVQAPDARQQYSDFEWGMITSPATHASIGLMVPGYNFTLCAATAYEGVQSGNYWQAGLGTLGMIGGGLELYGRLAPGSAGTQLTEMEASTGGHFLSRHGAQTSLSSQYMRSVSGLTPEGIALGETNATRFFSNELQLEAVKMAETRFNSTGETGFPFDMGKLVGEGYLKGGGAGSYRTTTQVWAQFKNGQLNTIYPLIQK